MAHVHIRIDKDDIPWIERHCERVSVLGDDIKVHKTADKDGIEGVHNTKTGNPKVRFPGIGD